MSEVHILIELDAADCNGIHIHGVYADFDEALAARRELAREYHDYQAEVEEYYRRLNGIRDSLICACLASESTIMAANLPFDMRTAIQTFYDVHKLNRRFEAGRPEEGLKRDLDVIMRGFPGITRSGIIWPYSPLREVQNAKNYHIYSEYVQEKTSW